MTSPRSLTRPEPKLSRDHQRLAIDATTGSLKWSYSAFLEFEKGAVVANGVVYTASRYTHMYAFDAASGVLEWSSPGLWSSPAVDNGFVYVADVTVSALGLP